MFDRYYIFFMLQLKDLQVFTVIRVIFQLAEEIPCISAVVVALLAEVPFDIPYIWLQTLMVCFIVPLMRVMA